MALKSFQHLLLTTTFLLVAGACYLMGYTWGFRVFFLLGAGFETVFWLRVFNRRYKSRQRLDELHQDSLQKQKQP